MIIQESGVDTPIKQLDLEQQQQIGDWHLIPKTAFLFFPKNQDIIIGEKEKQWRKIFENGEEYTQFEQQNLQLLDKKLKEYKIQLNNWFTKANLLRFLQAQKFKISETCTSIKEACHWRQKDFPLKIDHRVEALLKSGCAYYCGRDHHYRPILVVDIFKFKAEDEQFIPYLLMIMIEFMIGQLLIQGQVQNYILIMDLSQFSMGMKSTVTKILSFTSNTYRGRLFASYLLGMPGMLKFGWDAIASKFVSENTLKKIKISKSPTNIEMWTHIDKSNVQQKFGGSMNNIKQHFWPPSPELLNWKFDKTAPTGANYISTKEYQNYYLEGRLKRRKVFSEYIHHIRGKVIGKTQQNNLQAQNQFHASPLKNNSLPQIPPLQQVVDIRHSNLSIKSGLAQSTSNNNLNKVPSSMNGSNANSQIAILSKKMVQKQSKIIINERSFQLLFTSPEFLMISQILQ